MAITDTGVLRIITGKMAHLGQRQAVLAQNVANANTPGYKAKDLAPFTFDDAMKAAGGSGSGGTGMAVTNSAHIVPASMAGVNGATKNMKSFETVPSGNSVEMDQQMMETSKTAVDYQAFTSIYRKFVGLFRTAIGK